MQAQKYFTITLRLTKKRTWNYFLYNCKIWFYRKLELFIIDYSDSLITVIVIVKSSENMQINRKRWAYTKFSKFLDETYRKSSNKHGSRLFKSRTFCCGALTSREGGSYSKKSNFLLRRFLFKSTNFQLHFNSTRWLISAVCHDLGCGAYLRVVLCQKIKL